MKGSSIAAQHTCPWAKGCVGVCAQVRVRARTGGENLSH